MSLARSHLLLIFLVACPAAFGEDKVGPASFSSGEQRVSLIELYTSEGCSSCPPADRWLSKLKDKPGLWKDFAPIALHVDYWDYIGWTDRFAKSEYSHRQRSYVEQGGARFVYTPGFFRDGMEWGGWRSGEPARSGEDTVGTLDILVDGKDVAVRFTTESAVDFPLTVHVAVLGMNLETNVRAGENRGRKLQHDFVALGVRSISLEAAGSSYRAITRLPETKPTSAGQAIVAWVSEAGKLAPIQAAGGYLR